MSDVARNWKRLRRGKDYRRHPDLIRLSDIFIVDVNGEKDFFIFTYVSPSVEGAKYISLTRQEKKTKKMFLKYSVNFVF